jgi:hypothetical protein
MDEKVIYEILKKENPSFSESRLRATAKQIADNPQILESGMLGGIISKAAATKIGQRFAATRAGEGVKTVAGLAKTVKKPTKKQALLGGGALGIGGLAVQGGEDSGATTDVTEQANTNLMMAAAQYEAAGGDINALASTAAGKQLFSNPNFTLGSIIGSGNFANFNTGGVYTGKPVTISEYQWGSGGAKPKQTITDTVSLSDWKDQFPIADPKALAQWKSTLVSAGVVSASAGLAELQKQWEAWGQFSQEVGRKGQKLTPYQLLDIQRGLWGGGDGRDYSTQYRVDMLKPENVKSIYKSAREQEAGAIVGDEAAAAFAERVAAQQMAKPTKTEYKKIKGKMTPVTTPGYGEAEAAAAALALAKKDPLYAEFQTANVFGSAIEKALGVRP